MNLLILPKKPLRLMTYREAKGLVSSIKVRNQEVKQFYTHLATYLAVNTLFLTMNILDGPDAPVALLSIMFWGALLVRHSLKVFGWKGKKNKEWEKELLKELMDGEPIPGEEEALLSAHSERDVLRMKKRIENLEAIITSGKWQDLEEAEEVEVVQNRQLVEKLSRQV